MALIGAYFITKTEIGKEDVFIDVNNKERMGMKYNLEVQLISTDEDEVKYIIPFIQFVVDNSVTVCLPFVNEVQYGIYDEEKYVFLCVIINYRLN